MPRSPRGKRVVDPVSGSFRVVSRATRGHPEPFFDRTRGVWVAPWRKPDGKIGRPTGRTRAAADAINAAGRIPLPTCSPPVRCAMRLCSVPNSLRVV